LGKKGASRSVTFGDGGYIEWMNKAGAKDLLTKGSIDAFKYQLKAPEQHFYETIALARKMNYD
jgi:hypothetical protein